jgi:hypothetical protein
MPVSAAVISVFYDEANGIGRRLHCAARSRGVARSPTAMRRARHSARHEYMMMEMLPTSLKSASLLPATHHSFFPQRLTFSPSHYLVQQ